MIPDEVLEQAQQDMLNYDQTGQSPMELSHREAPFTNIMNQIKQSLRKLLKIPDEFAILFFQGGATGQFAAIPLNCVSKLGHYPVYFETGVWSRKAYEEAKKYVNADSVIGIPNEEDLTRQRNCISYFYYCSNETVDGIEFDQQLPQHNHLVADCSSNILTKPIDWAPHDIVFAGAQKNLGCAGVTIVIARKASAFFAHNKKARAKVPSILDYPLFLEKDSTPNTPPAYPIYVMYLMLKWVEKQGGVEEMRERCCKKAELVYRLIDESNGFYCNDVPEQWRSKVNVVFRICADQHERRIFTPAEEHFLEEAHHHGFIGLRGHRAKGGIRVSMYNSITVDDVQQLAHFMIQFQEEYKH